MRTTSRSVRLGFGIFLVVTSLAVHAAGLSAGQRFPAGGPPRDRAAASAILLTGASLIDGTGKPVVHNAWIQIDAGRIVALGAGAQPSVPGAKVIDLQGRTVLPGLSDMHVHVGQLAQAKWMLKLLLAHGVTTVRDTGNTVGNLAAVRSWLATEEAAPRLYASGVVLPGAEMEANLEFMKSGRPLQTILEDQAALGGEFVKFVKFHNWISLAALKQIAAFSKAHDLSVIGHIPLNMTSLAAIDAGMNVLEHIRLRPWEVLDDPEVIARYPIDIDTRSREIFWAYFDPNGQAVKRTLERWTRRKESFFFNPTLVINEGGSHYYDASYDARPDRKLVSPAIDQQWQNAPVKRANLTAEQRAESKRAHAGHLAFMRLVRAAGIRVLTGTDTPIPFIVPGVSLHRELELFVESGYSPIEAIQASTATAASVLRNADRGVIAPGREADLVIVHGDVAADIRALQHIEHVMVGGRLYGRSRLLDEAARLAAAHQPRSRTAETATLRHD